MAQLPNAHPPIIRRSRALQGYDTAWSSLVTCSQFGASIHRNTAEAFNEIAQGLAPEPVTGRLLAVRETGLWALQTQLSNPLWARTADSTPAFVVTATAASTVLDIQNTSAEAAAFEAFAFYRPAGATVQPSSSAKILVTAVKNLGPGETGPLELVYYDGHTGAVPSASDPIQISVLGWNRTGAFYIGSGDSPIQWNLTLEKTPYLMGRRGPARANGPSPTNVVLISNPIRPFITQNPTNQSYEAMIQV